MASRGRVCRILGFSRQALYKGLQMQSRKDLKEAGVLTEVQAIRQRQPYVGTRKLHRMLLRRGVRVGRDQLFALLRRHNILQKRRRNYKKTTYSNHWLKKYPNHIKDLDIIRPNQAFVSDITYIRTRDGIGYLTLITDLYSRKIVGWELCPNLTAAGPQKALDRALSGVTQPENLIHHSDRGIQFCSRGYVNRLEQKGVRVSMTEDKHVYENAVAERKWNIEKGIRS